MPQLEAFLEAVDRDGPAPAPKPAVAAPGPRELLGLAAVALLATGLRVWGLEQNGHGNVYYAAAVRSMLASGSNFVFGSFDPAGFVTVDKPPVALWIQGFSAWLFGYRGLALLLPQAIMGTASVLLTYWLVRRVFGTAAGLIAGLVLAVTPICVAVDRDNLPDTALVLALLLAAWALLRAVETGTLGPLLVSALLVGVGFNIKMLAAFVVLPTFYLVYLAGSSLGWGTRIRNLAAATAVLAVASLSWSIAVELTPTDRRPYIGGSTNNSALQLALGYNGFGRIFGGLGNFGPPGGRPDALKKAFGNRPDDRKGQAPPFADAGDPRSLPTPPGFPGGGPMAGPADEPFPPFPPGGIDPDDLPPGGFPGFPPGGPGGPFPGGPPGFRGGPPGFGGTPGPLRFAQPGLAGQISWLFPIALIGAGVAAGRVDRRRPLDRGAASLLLWAGWFGTHWVVFSFARGVFHEYYATVMGPALAALTGIGTVALWREWESGRIQGRLLSLAILATAAWALKIIAPQAGLRDWLLPLVIGGAVVGLVGLVRPATLSRRATIRPWDRLAGGVGLASLLLGPACWSLGTALAKGNAMMPAASPAILARDADADPPPGMPPFDLPPEAVEPLLGFLHANRQGERIVVAAPAIMGVASLIVATGEPAIALGGFIGGDPVLDKDRFVRMVEAGELRFVLLGGPGPGGGGFPGGPGGAFGGGPGGPPGGMPPGLNANSAILEWVREHGKAVDPGLWRPEEDEGPVGADPMAGFGRMMRRMERLYDCRPERGWVDPRGRALTAF